ncbi:DUF2065 domain-containing protein [Limnohabitans sp. Rim8]|uniref:DUF2065 domain-containing protein n=1 Tax=Limnohabitans sp. Rim8 TaxID=1100718 RepID=UPI003305FB1B
MLEQLLIALALMLIIEGILPMASPMRWRKMFEQLLRLEDGQIRFFGLCSALVGLILLLCVS